MIDTSQFYRHLADSYREQRAQTERQNAILWESVIALINVIADAELDGSSIKTVREQGEKQAKRLKDMLDPPSMREMLYRQELE